MRTREFMRSGRSLLRGIRQDCRGSTAVEFGLVASLFFLLLASIIEICMLLLAQLSLDNALDHAGRSVFTGVYQQGASAVNPTARLITSLCENVFLFQCNDQTVKLEMTVNSTPSSPYDTTTNSESSTFGTRFDCPVGGDMVTIVAAVKLPRFFNYLQVFARPLADFKQQIQSTAIFQSEPYPQGQC